MSRDLTELTRIIRRIEAKSRPRPSAPRSWRRSWRARQRRVELIVNGEVAAERVVPADGEVHAIAWDVPITQSSWVALRQFSKLHTNPVTIHVAGQPIQASKRSAQWRAEMTEQLWRNRRQQIHEAERDAATRSIDRAIAHFRQLVE